MAREKKSKRVDDEDEDVDEAPKKKTVADAPSRPLFSEKYPRDPELDALVFAFEAGDYGRVRTDAPALASKTDDEGVRRAALDLRKRLDPSPVSLMLVVIAFLLLAILAFYYLRLGHAHEGAVG